MRTDLRIATLAAACAIFWPAVAARVGAQVLTVKSPDGKLVVSFSVKSLPPPYQPGSRPYYSVSFEGEPLLADSPLGLQFDGAPALDHDLSVAGSSTDSHDSSWEDPINDNRTVRDHYNELTVHLQEGGSAQRRLDIIFRAYDGGVAFRYVLPQQAALPTFVLSNEDTGFYFARTGSAFALRLDSFTTAYEDEFRQVALDEIEPSWLVGLPLLVHVHQGPWVAVTEADLEDYAGTYITRAAHVPDGLATRLSPLPDHPGQAVKAATPKASPWRLLMVSPEPGGLIESHDLVLNLNPPCALEDTSWIEPGKTAWDWWSGDYATGVSFKPGMNTETLEHYIQFSADHHLPYMLIDAGWARFSDADNGWDRADITHWNDNVDLPKVIAFAKERHVKVLLWMHWQSVQKQMEEAFPLFEKWGVSGIKVDFMNRDDQEMVNFYYRVTREAAKHHLVVDFHGAFKPTGMRRTYPNQLTREGVLGMEYNKWSYRDTPYHHLILPFTRMLAGPLDYTPGCFNNATRDQFEPRMVNPMCQATRAHQLAMYVVYFSPLQMLSDYPEDYDHNPGMDFLDQVPTVWDETRVIDGDPGESITVARRQGNTWYLGSMTDWTPRDLDIPLSFLGSGAYRARIYSDGPDAARNASDLSTRDATFQAGDHLTVHLAFGGGLAATFTPASAGP
ncbi:MAG TPA: glycoside hydrolase family 97 protein [Terriglobia bacterium]